MVGNKGKKQKVEEEEIDLNQYVDDELILSVDKLQEVQEELEKINEEVSEKVLEIERKYDVVRKPVYDKRTDVIKSIPDFWLTAFLSHPVLGALLTEDDQLIFRYITSIEVDDLKDVKSGYSITFHFNPNPYFDNSKLSKTYTSIEDRPTKITATTIKWKEGTGIPKAVPQKKNGKKRPHPQESFFTWFSEVTHKDDGDNDENEDVEFQDEVGEVIKDDLWPNPLTYFNDSDEEDSESDEEDSSESSEDEEEDEMDDDEDEEDK